MLVTRSFCLFLVVASACGVESKPDAAQVRDTQVPHVTLVGGRLRGHTGCNDFAATFAATPASFQVTQLSIGDNDCGDELMATETDFLLRLDQVRDYQVGKSLLLTDANGAVVWEATIEDQEAAAALAAKRAEPFVLVTAETITGSVGCNRFLAQYEHNGNDIAVGPIAQTLKLCHDEGVMESEREMIEMLAIAERFAVEARKMHLFDADDVYLTTLDIDSDKTAQSFSAAPIAYATVDTEAARISGFSGCNQFAATYSTNDDEIAIEPIIISKRYCETGDEANYLSTLSAAATFSVHEKHIRLFDKDGEFLLTLPIR